MLTPLVAYVLPALHVVSASESGGAEGESGTFWTAYLIGVVVLSLFIAMVTAVMSIGRGKDAL